MGTPLTEFEGGAIYLDTMLPYALMRGITADADSFFARIENRELLAYTSALTFDELAYRLVLALVKEKYGGSPLELYRLEQAKMIAEFAPRIVTELRRLRTYANLTVLDVLSEDLERMNEAMLAYQLQPRDALHYAAMFRVGCLHLASNDTHFDRIPAIVRYTF